MNASYNNAALIFRNMKLFLIFCGSFKNLFICKILFVFLIIGFYQLIKDLTFF